MERRRCIFFNPKSRTKAGFSLPSLCFFLHFLYSRKSSMVNVHCFSALCYRWTTLLRGCTQSPAMRGSLHLPPPLLQYVLLRFWYNIRHVSSELQLHIFCCFISGDVLTWYINKSEGDYTRWNINKNSSFPLLPYLWWFFASIQTR